MSSQMFSVVCFCIPCPKQQIITGVSSLEKGIFCTHLNKLLESGQSVVLMFLQDKLKIKE